MCLLKARTDIEKQTFVFLHGYNSARKVEGKKSLFYLQQQQQKILSDFFFNEKKII